MSYNRDCGCGQLTPGSRTFGHHGCCGHQVQTSPQPCCEAHKIVYKNNICFHTTCNVVASTEDFPLSLKNNCSNLPMNANDVFFYHAGAGLLQIVGFDNVSYWVRLVDQTKAGAVIRPEDCIIVTVNSTATGTVPIALCLSGNFTAPAVNATETIYILNGSNIPTGSVITFTANGETGSYTVVKYLSGSGNTYAYEVSNSGSGHVPGTIINGGECGSCDVPIIVDTNVNICNLEEASTADSLTACLNGSPRAFVPPGENDVPVGTAEGTWTTKKLTNLDCCVVIDDCLKFSGSSCPNNTDQVVLRDVNLECFEEAFNDAVAHQQNLPMTVEGLDIVATGYDSGTKTITVTVASSGELSEPLSYDAGTQLCIGDCCSSCLTGDQITDHKAINEDPRYNALIGLDLSGGEITAPVGTSYWLVGQNNTTGAVEVKELDAPYFANPSTSGPGLPTIADPMVMRQKMCNTSNSGCDQVAELDFNAILALDPLPASVKAYWEVAHYAQSSATLEDGTTPNPFNTISTQNKDSGWLDGASAIDATMTNSSFGTGSPGDNKVYPFANANFRDFIYLEKCNCALSMVWWFLRIENGTAGATAMNTFFTFRRRIRKAPWNWIEVPINNPASEGFNDI